MAPLAPLAEEPGNEDDERRRSSSKAGLAGFHRWARALFFASGRNPATGDLRILLSVLACPLSPVPVHRRLPLHVASSAQYIMQQFRATTGCAKIEGGVKSMYAAGRVRLGMSQEPSNVNGRGGSAVAASGRSHHEGCFVMWQLVPDMWLVEMAVAGHMVAAGSDGRLAWRRTPWVGAHAARGGPRPLRRALQGLDPVTIAAVFTPAQHIGEEQIGDEECFILKLDVDQAILASWSDSTAEIIKHGMVGYFSQRSGLLVRLEDTQLTRIQSPGAQAMYWETTIVSQMEDYRSVDGVMIAHSGRSTAHLVRFGVGLKANRILAQMEEAWSIDDVLFNVPGLSTESFIPPEEVRKSHFFDSL